MSGENLPQGGELNAVVSRFIEDGNEREEIYPALKNIMPKDEELSVPEPLIKLASIQPLKLFVSTTFDPLLERALNQVRFGGQNKTLVCAYAPDEVKDLSVAVEQLHTPVVYHIFGKLSAVPAYAVTQEDTLEFLHSLQSEIRQPKLLFDELKRRNLLILGSSFTGWLARFFLRTTKCQRLLIDRDIDYVADAQVSEDENLVHFLRRYSSRTKVYVGGAVGFIDELHRRWREQHPENAPDTDVTTAVAHDTSAAMEAGAVFLSYASEDRVAVEAINRALAEAGIDVFFDKQALEVGDDFEAKIRRCISSCSLFMPVISQHTVTSQRRFFRIEWNLALEEALKVSADTRFILPVVIDDTAPTDPAVPEGIRKLHWETMPAGQTRSEFVETVKNLFRDYQKSLGRAL